MTSKVIALIVAQAVVVPVAVVGLVVFAPTPIEPAPVAFGLFALLLVAVTRLPPMYVELRRHGSWITPADGAYVIGWVALGPLGFVLAVVLAEVLSWTGSSQTVLKRSFNLVSIAGGAAVASLVYVVAGGGSDPLAPGTWRGAILALVVVALWDAVVHGLVLAVTEGEPFRRMVAEVGRPLTLTLAASIPFGAIALVLYGWAWPSLFLLLPVLALLHLSAHATLRQRADRQRVQQLAEASAQLVELVDVDDLLGRIADRARELVTGAEAFAVVRSADGSIEARRVDDHGVHGVDAAQLRVFDEVVGERASGQVATPTLPRAQRSALPPHPTLLWAAHRAEDEGTLTVVTFREFPHDRDDAHRTDVLASFVTHAATAHANGRLHADVQRNLAEELALSLRKDEFVATVSHELRTPLTSISGALETVRHRGELLGAADRTRLLEVAWEHVGRLHGLIDDLLVVAEGEGARLGRRDEVVDLHELLADLEEEFHPWFEGRLHLHAELATARVATDGDKLRRILAHLLDNAWKFGAGRVDLAATTDGEQLHLTVDDEGQGIVVEDRERVFDRFVQVDSSTTREHGGLGLGLHVCRQLADALGGQLRTTASPRGGARFALSLPLAAEADADVRS